MSCPIVSPFVFGVSLLNNPYASTIIFAASAVSCLVFISFNSRESRTSTAIDKEYMSTISKLFKPLQTIPRHSIAQAFEIRKSFFLKQYNQSKLSKQKQPVKIIHVAGTKGKGSTVEYISSALRSSSSISDGKNKDNLTRHTTVGVFTSPHLHTARERFRINNQLISKRDFSLYGERALQIAHETKHESWMVFFDYLILIAIDYFGDQTQPMDYIVLETGIGGRYDSSNFLPSVDAAVITRIGLDHQALLGETIEEIAYQKAGIIKPYCHAFTPANQQPSVLEVIRKQCREVNATLHEVPIGREHLPHALLNAAQSTSSSSSFISQQLQYDVQVENFCLSVAVLKHLNVPLVGLLQFYWPCRMEKFTLADDCLLMRNRIQQMLMNSGSGNSNSISSNISVDSLDKRITQPHRQQQQQQQDLKSNKLLSSSSSSLSTSSSSFLSLASSHNLPADAITYNVSLVIDGSHNGESVEKFLTNIRRLEGKSQLYKNNTIIYVLFGAGEEKNVSDMLKLLKRDRKVRHNNNNNSDNDDNGMIDCVQFIQSQHYKALSEQQLETLYLACGDNNNNNTDNTRNANNGHSHITSSKLISSLTNVGEVYEGDDFLKAVQEDKRYTGGTIYHRLEFLLAECRKPHSDFFATLISKAAVYRDGSESSREVQKIVLAVCGSLFAAAEAREVLYRNRPELFAVNDWVQESDSFLLSPPL